MFLEVKKRYLAKFGLILVFILSTLLISLISLKVGASDWSWTNEPPTVVSSAKTSYINKNYCASPHEVVDIYGENGTKSVCVSKNDKISFGIYYSQVWNGFTSVIKVGNDSKMHLIRTGCNGYDSCLYLPQVDTLVYKQNINGIARALVLYKNFSRRIKFEKYSLYQEYNFDNSNPDYIYKRSNGDLWGINGIGASKNGRWLFIEAMGVGIMRLDTETMEMKRISILSYSYNVGMNPSLEMAVSDDGKHIAIMGMNTPIHIMDINDNCGDFLDDNSIMARVPIMNPCKEAEIRYNEIIPNFYAGLSPRFDEDGGELNFFAIAGNGDSHEVTLRGSGEAVKKIEYIALGDSFTSGEGETEDSYYLSGTNDKYDKCHVSSRSYPFLVANLQNIDGDLVKSVACSGAVIGDVIGDDILSYYGQKNRLGSSGLNQNPTDIGLSRSLAKDSFQPGRIYQENFVSRYKPDVITVSIGGNDAGLMGKLSTCITPGICNWASNDEDREQVALEIKSLFSKLVDVYKKLHLDSPTSKIYAIGYPKIINPNGQCDLVVGAMFNKEERQFIDEGISYLDRVVESAAKAVGIGYIDIKNSFGDQALCGNTSPIVMNTVRTGDDISYGWIINIGNESFHPTPEGHKLIANKIDEQIKSLSDHQYCADQTTSCSDDTVKAPEPSSYWIPDGFHDYPDLINSNFLVDNSENNSTKDIDLPEYSLLPGSEARVEITSTAKNLGTYIVASDGSLKTEIELPDDLEYGYHTVHIYGTSNSNEPIELYQIIEYREKREVAKVSDPIISAVKNDSTDKINEVDSNDENHSNIVKDTTNVLNGNESHNSLNNFIKPEVKGLEFKNNRKNNKILLDSMETWQIVMSVFALVALTVLVIVKLVKLKR